MASLLRYKADDEQCLISYFVIVYTLLLILCYCIYFVNVDTLLLILCYCIYFVIVDPVAKQTQSPVKLSSSDKPILFGDVTCKSDSLQHYEPPRDKTNIMSMRPAKTQISLGIRPV